MNARLRFELGGGEFPFLTRCQLQLLDEVQAVLETKVFSYRWRSLNTENDMMNAALQISLLEKHVKIMMKHLKIGRKAKLHFTETYPKWRQNRENCVVKLKEIANSLNEDRFNCNVSKMVGYCASFVGGGITLASAILIPFTMGLTTPLAIAGGTVTAAGCGTAIGTSVTEITLLKKKVAIAKKLIEDDKRYFEEMKDWLNNASELQESLSAVSRALSDILGTSIMKDMTADIEKFVNEAIKIQNVCQRKEFVNKRLTPIINKFIERLAQKKLHVAILINVITVIVIVLLLFSNKNNRLIFDCSSLTIRSLLGVVSLVDNSMELFRLSSLFAGNATVAKTFARAVTRGAVATVGMALDVIGIVFTSVDIHKGSLSPEAQKINEAAVSLEEEADVLKRVYDSMSHPPE